MLGTALALTLEPVCHHDRLKIIDEPGSLFLHLLLRIDKGNDLGQCSEHGDVLANLALDVFEGGPSRLIRHLPHCVPDPDDHRVVLD